MTRSWSSTDLNFGFARSKILYRDWYIVLSKTRATFRKTRFWHRWRGEGEGMSYNEVNVMNKAAVQDPG
jgi:hypothetical protein